MARRRLIAGNWKMNKTVSEALDLLQALKNQLASVRDCDLAIAPPYTALWPVSQRLQDSNIALAGQELHPADGGAFTGAICGAMLKELGCKYTLVGHSERRQLFGETLDSSRQRVQAAYKHGLIPILCIGETLEQREAGQTMQVVSQQLDAGIEGLSFEQLAPIIIAYEPVWAIGTGKVATPAQAQEVHAMIRQRLRAKDAGIADGIRILYGGSVKPDNAQELLALEDVDGALVGGASLNADSFAGIAKAR